MLSVRGTTICGFVVEMLKLFSEDYVRVALTKIFFFSLSYQIQHQIFSSTHQGLPQIVMSYFSFNRSDLTVISKLILRKISPKQK